ncbi:MAG: LacI family DNA-binding transcriptional regulator [Eubacteriales bacterium]|nr:LacI family DNA-binding transcriptional regulator [Eubacteriales bacterium]
MAVTAKFLAEKLHLSQTAVSMALRNKPGVSTETRQLVLKTAEQYGYDFSRLAPESTLTGSIYVILYKTSNAILSYTPIFDEYIEGVRRVAEKEKLHVKLLQIWEKSDDLERSLEEIRGSDCIGIVLVGTEITAAVCRRFTSLTMPVVLLDTYLEDVSCDSVLINNETGAYKATDYLISRAKSQPGYIRSSYRIPNFEERLVGYKKAIRANGMSVSRSVMHELAPSFDGAFADMMQIIQSKEPLAQAYFCENDILAISTIKALKASGFRVPEDIAVIGFDNIQEARIIDPSLTTMDVPRQFLGESAIRQLLFRIQNRVPASAKIAITPVLVKRFST